MLVFFCGLGDEEGENGVDDGGDEIGDRRGAKNGKDEENEDDKAIPRKDCVPFVGQFFGEKADEDFSTIQRVDGDEVEDGEDDIDADRGDHDDLEKEGSGEDAEEKGEKGGEEEVGNGSGKADDRCVFSGISQVKWIEEHGFTPAKPSEEDGESSQRIEVGPGVEGEAALESGRGVAELVGGPSVGKLVDGDGHDQAREDHEKRDEAGGEEDAEHCLCFSR